MYRRMSTLTEKDNKTSIVYTSYSDLNLLKKGTLEFSKTDVTTSDGIADTIIEIYHLNENGKDELIFTGKTDGNGKIIIKDLFIGKFYIVEKEATSLF